MKARRSCSPSTISPLAGVVRWRNDQVCGIEFNGVIPFGEHRLAEAGPLRRRPGKLGAEAGIEPARSPAGRRATGLAGSTTDREELERVAGSNQRVARQGGRRPFRGFDHRPGAMERVGSNRKLEG